MKPEMFKFEKSGDDVSEEEEITLEQKKELGEAWADLVVDSDLPENIDQFDSNDFKKWLSQSVMKGVEGFTEELGIDPDQELIERIKKAENIEEKSKLELDYIKDAYVQVDKIVQGFNETGKRSTRWDSWPKRMKETKQFNCVGATLVGTNLLDKAGIESFYGAPCGHAVNIVRLSNGEWWHVDFINGKGQMVRFDPEEIYLENIPTLKIDNPKIDYNLIPVYDKSEAPAFILGNLGVLEKEAGSKDISDDDPGKKEAKEYLEKHKSIFSKNDFSTMHQVLYPETIAVEETKEMKNEESRISKLRAFEKPVQDYIQTLPKETVEALFREVKENSNLIEDLFYKEDDSVIKKVSPELKKVLETFARRIKTIKEKEPEDYQEIIERVVEKMKNL